MRVAGYVRAKLRGLLFTHAIVPRESTSTMRLAAVVACDASGSNFEDVSAAQLSVIYRAMIIAAEQETLDNEN